MSLDRRTLNYGVWTSAVLFLAFAVAGADATAAANYTVFLVLMWLRAATR